ncbi:MAG TPA: hypothetical protein VLK22_04650 [Candidatus Udaeobacter sp.]|nr:hypothetical protein [Candidatus Udaeobacter sp.]
MSEEAKSGLKINYWFLLSVFGIILASILVSSSVFIKANGILNKKLTETKEANRPANLELTILNDQNCSDCFDVKPLLDQLQKENVKFNTYQSIDSASEAGKQLITKFAIKKLPTFTLSGELTKNPNLAKFFSQAGDITANTFVFRQTGGPYTDVMTGKVKGRLNLTLLTDITCTECYDVTQHENILKQFGMQPNAKVVDIKSAEGTALKNKYGIKMVPTFVLSGDVNAYPSFKPVWPQVGIIATDGAYVFTKGVPLMGTYKNLTTNKVIVPPAQPPQK